MSAPPQVIYAHLKYLWATGAREETLTFLREFTGKLSGDLGLHPDSDQGPAQELVTTGRVAEYTHLLARCYYKLGEWQSAQQDNWGSVSSSLIRFCFVADLRTKTGCHSRYPPVVPPRDEPRSDVVQGVARVGSSELGSRHALRKVDERAGHGSASGLHGSPRAIGPRSARCPSLHPTTLIAARSVLPVDRPLARQLPSGHPTFVEIGRASCRERVS